MDPLIGVWIHTITERASMAKAWFEAQKAGLELKDAKKHVRSALTVTWDEVSATEADLAERLIIPESTLKVLVADIERAARRFENCLDECTPDEVDGEEQRARVAVCKHLQRIRDFNGGRLPPGNFEELWTSWNCQSGKVGTKKRNTVRRRMRKAAPKEGTAKRRTRTRPSSRRTAH
jgi:hypothetical protein